MRLIIEKNSQEKYILVKDMENKESATSKIYGSREEVEREITEEKEKNKELKVIDFTM